MPRQPLADSAPSFVLATLTAHPDREMQVADFVQLAGDRYKKPALSKACDDLVKRGAIERYKDGHSSWYAIAI